MANSNWKSWPELVSWKLLEETLPRDTSTPDFACYLMNGTHEWGSFLCLRGCVLDPRHPFIVHPVEIDLRNSDTLELETKFAVPG